MAFRRRRFPRRFNGRRRRSSPFEVSQGRAVISFALTDSDTDNVHQQFDLHVLSQIGLARSLPNSGTGTRSGAVLLAGTKSISVSWIKVQAEVVALPKVAGTAPLVSIVYAPFAACIYKAPLLFSGSTVDMASTIVPRSAGEFNLLTGNQIGGAVPLMTADTAAAPNVRDAFSGAVHEVFGFPGRILHREWWLQPLLETDTAVTDESFWAMQAHPGIRVRKSLFGKKCRLNDNEGLFFRIEGKGGTSLNNQQIDLGVVVTWIACYKQRF